MTDKRRILIVEDSLPEGAMLLDILEDEGYEVNHVLDAELGLKAYREDAYDLILLDVMLPGKDGFQMAKQIKALNQDAPIIFLTARTLKSDEIQGFTLGADDYLTKPYDRELLIWRIKAVLKRHSGVEIDLSGTYQIGSYLFDYKNLTLTRMEEVRRITKREADVLHMLCINAGELVKREDLLLSIWGINDYFNGRSLDVFITKLRKYLKEDPEVVLINIHGVGFELRYPKQ
ncbi:MAG: response regulator transcription factor [Salinivirgaceae bacterium]|nr:response regulator transcription factor [Salinivirgaceae bacterium]MDY0280295.1 response regulator transcription factor [Salinivirgaceae bacterium]